MFSLTENQPAGTSAGTADAEKFIPGSQHHALTLPATWQGIVDDCTRVRGRRVGMAWERTLAWTLMAIIGVWGAGTLLSTLPQNQPWPAALRSQTEQHLQQLITRYAALKQKTVE